MTTQTVTREYIEGIKEGRQFMARFGAEPGFSIEEHIAATRATLKGFGKNSPVGQMLQGEIDFFKNQISKQKGASK